MVFPESARPPSAPAKILWALAAACLLGFAAYVFVLDRANTLHGGTGWFLIAIGVVLFAADFFIIRYVINRHYRARRTGRHEQ